MKLIWFILFGVFLLSAFFTGLGPKQPKIKVASPSATYVVAQDQRVYEATPSLQLHNLGLVEVSRGLNCQSETGLTVSFLVDISSSMADKLDSLKEAIRNFAPRLRLEDLVGVQFFHSFAGNVFDFSTYRGNEERFITRVNQIQARDFSRHMLDGFIFTKSKLDLVSATNPNNRQVIIFISDGGPSPSSQNPINFVNTEIKQPGIILITIALGANPEDQVFISSLASGQRYFYPALPSNINQIFQNITSFICR